MLEMVKSSIGLFFRGKLFAEPGKALGQLAKGILLTVLVFLGAVYAGAPIWAAAAAAGFVGGFLQPYFFKDLRYR